MERFWTKEVRRRMAAIVCAALMITAVFQYFSPVNAQEQAKYTFNLGNIQVYVDDEKAEGEYSVSGNEIIIGGTIFKIDQTGSVTGNDVALESLIIESEEKELPITVTDGNGYSEPPHEGFAFWGAKTSISGNNNAEVQVMLYKKHSLHAKVYIQTTDSEEDLEDVETQITYKNLDDEESEVENPNEVRINKKGYQAEATLGRVVGSAKATMDGNEPGKIIFRGYAEYGTDFYFIDQDENELSFDKDYYSISKIVINPNEFPSNSNPFTGYELEIGEVTVTGNTDEKKIIGEDILSGYSGEATITFKNSGFPENLTNNKISFIIDNKAPEFTEVSYCVGSVDPENLEETNFTNIEINKQTGKIEMDSSIKEEGIVTIKIEVQETYGLADDGKLTVSYQQGEDSISGSEDKETGVYVYLWEAAADTVFENICFSIQDKVGNEAKLGVINVEDGVAPRVSDIKWKADAGDSQEIPQNGKLIAKNTIAFDFIIEENHDITSAVLNYMIGDGSGLLESSKIDGKIDGKKCTFELKQTNSEYTDFKLVLKDSNGNEGSISLNDKIKKVILDSISPDISLFSWKADGGEESESVPTDGKLLAEEEVELQFKVEETNELKQVILSYKVDGKEGQQEATETELKNKVCTFTFGASNSNYTDLQLYMEDEVGNWEKISSPEGIKEVILDNAAPAISSCSWKADDGIESSSVSDSGELSAKDKVELQFEIEEKNALTSVILSYKVNGTEEQKVATAQELKDKVCVFTFNQANSNYTDLQLYMEDEVGNREKISSPEGIKEVILDNTYPVMGELRSDVSEENISVYDGVTTYTSNKSVTYTIPIEERNLSQVYLVYLDENGNETNNKIEMTCNSEGDYSCNIDSSTYNYHRIIFVAEDKSGNRTLLGDDEDIRVVIDNATPGIENNIVSPDMQLWYSKNSEEESYMFYFTEGSDLGKGIGDSEIRLVCKDNDGNEIKSWDLMEIGTVTKVSRDEKRGLYTYQVSVSSSIFFGAEDQELTYSIEVTDRWGQKAEKNGVITVQVDNTAPSNVAYVAFSGDKDKLYNTRGDLAGKHYQYGNSSVSGTIYNQNTVQLKIYVADLPGANAINQAASGIAEVKVNYRYTEESVTLSKAEYEKKDTLTYGGENNENVIRTPATVTINNQELSMDELDFNLDITNGQRQKITSIDSIELWDAAGNYTKITEFASADDLTVDYVLDNTAPELSHEIPGSSGYGKDANTYYYSTNAVDMYVTIAENNFFPDDVKTNLKAGEATKTVTMSAFQNIGSYNYRSHFTMDEGDGVYRFTLGYQDRSENVMVFQGGGEAYVADGTYTSPILVLDTTAPVLNIRYYRGGQDITDSITGGMCFSGDVSAVISITEVNFDPELVQIAFSATDAGNNQAFGITYNPSAWNRNGDTWSYTIPCTTEGHYSLTASCTDKAGNHSNGVPTSNFTIDKTAPAVAITYDTTVENGYYNTNRTATVTVTDQNFNEQAIEYVITSTGMQPALTGWSHGAGSGCSGTNHVKSCRWSCQAVFSEDADYTFGFNCVDRAGNASVSTEEQAFTIDQTLPVIQVGYDNNDSLNGYYFKEGRTATITITEHNFNSGDVNLVISSPDGEVHNPTAWRNSTADVYVCEIPYNADGDYSFDISYTDLAGNAAEAYAGDQFVIDLTAPMLEISGVEDKSANNGVVAPVVSFSDKNYDAEEVTVTITGVNNGRTALEYAVTTNADGQTLEFMDFSHTQEMDDLYTLEAVITDKAGNSTEDSILFSVNRFGSVYIFSEDTQAVLDRFYTNQGPELTITEINVDTLEHQEISYSCDGNVVVLNPGTDYTVQESGSEYEWKQYTYEIAGSNFDAEGVYAVTIQSVDRAANDMTNRLKEKSIEFTVDKTAPGVVLGGIEDGGSYAETSRILTIDAVDNIYLESVEIYLNEELAASFDEDTLAEYHGQVSYEVQEAGSVQTLYIIARDAAGNEMQTDLIRFLISSNVLIRWFYNRPLFFGSIAGVLAVAGGCSFLVFKRRKKKETVEG